MNRMKLLAALALVALLTNPAQAADAAARATTTEEAANAFPLSEDRGASGLMLALKRLRTTASALMITAHPDDEDAALLTELARGRGVRVTLFSLTRGEGGQNAVSAEANDALGLIRTEEQLAADARYGVQQLWGSEADFGFSKTPEESFAQWTHERALYDVVLAIRRTRPQILLSVFIGGPSDGHGHHQVAGQITQEAFRAAGDPAVFPEQLKDGLTPWRPMAVYTLVPRAPIQNGRIFDYATGKWAPAGYKNYLTGLWTPGALPVDVTVEEGLLDAVSGLSSAQIAHTGYAQHRTQFGGSAPALRGPVRSQLHLWATSPDSAPGRKEARNDDLFANQRLTLDTSLAGLARRLGPHPPAWLPAELGRIDQGLRPLSLDKPAQTAESLAALYRRTLALRARIAAAGLDPGGRAALLFEVDQKIEQFQQALANLLGLDLSAYVARAASAPESEEHRAPTPDMGDASVHPGENFLVRARAAQGSSTAHLTSLRLTNSEGEPWSVTTQAESRPAPWIAETTFAVKVPVHAPPTAPYFTRASVEQPYYDLARPELRLRSFAPYPLTAQAEYEFHGLPIRLEKVVQTLRALPGAVEAQSQPLTVTPALSLRIEPEARILAVDGAAFPLRVFVRTERAATGTVELQLPAGWSATPTQAAFHTTGAGESEPLLFTLIPAAQSASAVTIQAVAQADGRAYASEWRTAGYPGVRPYNLYQPAAARVRRIDAKLAPGLRIGYVMGSGDRLPEALAELGAEPQLLPAATLATADLTSFDTIILGVRAYVAHPELVRAQERLNAFVREGGALLVGYQSDDFPAPLPLGLGGKSSEKVVEERAPVKILAPSDPLLNWPNAITAEDFNGWVEERGHGFAKSWDPGFTALTETADAGQDPQRGGLLTARIGRGRYIYVAYALHRQSPELVPGAYRLLANLASAGRQKN